MDLYDITWPQEVSNLVIPDKSKMRSDSNVMVSYPGFF